MTDKPDNTSLVVLGWLFGVPALLVSGALMYQSMLPPEPVKQSDPAKERRVVTIIKWLWEKD